MLLDEDTVVCTNDEHYVYKINDLYNEFMKIYNSLFSLGVCNTDTYNLFQYYVVRAWNNVIDPIPVSIYSWQLSPDTISGIGGKLHAVTKDACQYLLEVPRDQREEVAILLQQIAPNYKHFV